MICHCGPVVGCDTCETREERAVRAFLAASPWRRLCALAEAGFRPAVSRRIGDRRRLRPTERLSERFRAAMLEVFRALLPEEKERVVEGL